MRKSSISKKAVAVVLILAIAVASVFAADLTPRKGFGDARVYDGNYKAVPNAKSVSDGYVIRTAENSVVLDNATTHVEIDANTLAIFLSLDSNVKIYVLDGRALVSSTSGDFTVMTTVTTYTAKSGSSIYVITDPTREMGYITDGNAQVQNYITGANTILSQDKYINNAITAFAPELTTTPKFWGSLAPEAKLVEQATVQQVPSPLTTTFSYGGYKATLTAFKGYAVLTYPSFVTNEEIEAAARAAVEAYPQYMQGIYYQITEPGKVTLSYPESYGEKEFNLAANLLNAELPAYIASLFREKEPIIEESSQTQVASTQVASTQLEQTTTETEPEKTPLETVPRPQEQEVEAEVEKESDFRFGLWAGAIYGAGKDGDTFIKFPYTDGRVGAFWKDIDAFVRPYIQYKSFTFGLDLSATFRDLKFDSSYYKIDTEHGVPGYINSVARYISVIGFEGEHFGLVAKINSNFESSSPVYNSYDWRYDWKKRLVTNFYVKAGVFSLTGFLDDLRLSNKLESRGEYAGFRAGVQFGGMKAGLSLIADIGKEFKDYAYFPSVDLTVPFTVSDTKFNFVVNGAAHITANESFKLNGYLGQGLLEIGYGPVYIGFGGSYNKGSHFSDLITNAPITTVGFSDGSSFDVIFKAKLDTKVFDLDAKVRVPVGLNGTGLVQNTIRTKSGALRDMSADAFDIQAQLQIGGFTFIIGGSSYGFSGKVKEVFSSFGDSEKLKAALVDIISPDTAAFFTEFDFKANIGSTGTLDIFLRGDVSEIESRIRIPLSLGVSYKF